MGLREGGPKWVGPFYPFASWLMTHSQWPRSSHGHSAAPADLVPSIIYIGNVLLRVSPCVSTLILLGPLLYWRLSCHAGLCSIFHQSNDCCIWKYNRIKLYSEYSESLNEQLTFCIIQAISFDIYWRKKISGVEEKNLRNWRMWSFLLRCTTERQVLQNAQHTPTQRLGVHQHTTRGCLHIRRSRHTQPTPSVCFMRSGATLHTNLLPGKRNHEALDWILLRRRTKKFCFLKFIFISLENVSLMNISFFIFAT